jgi:hypothetical protein
MKTPNWAFIVFLAFLYVRIYDHDHKFKPIEAALTLSGLTPKPLIFSLGRKKMYILPLDVRHLHLSIHPRGDQTGKHKLLRVRSEGCSSIQNKHWKCG